MERLAYAASTGTSHVPEEFVPVPGQRFWTRVTPFTGDIPQWSKTELPAQNLQNASSSEAVTKYVAIPLEERDLGHASGLSDCVTALILVLSRYGPGEPVTFGLCLGDEPYDVRVSPEVFDGDISQLQLNVQEYLHGPSSSVSPRSAFVGLTGLADEASEGLQPPLWPLSLRVGPRSLEATFNDRDFDLFAVEQFIHHWSSAIAYLRGSRASSPVSAEFIGPEGLDALVGIGRPAQQGCEKFADLTIVDVFRGFASSRPHAEAITLEGTTLTYAQLHDRSDLLARHLQLKGVSPGDRVGVCLERSIDLVASMIAVLKCGAILVPLDTHLPLDRLLFISEETTWRLVLIEPSLSSLPRAITLEQLTSNPETEPRPSSVELSADMPAYIIFTSGSSGRPKGVLVAHSSVVALVEATKTDLDLHGEQVWSFFHSVSFDFSVWEIFGCLLTGARLVMVPYWIARSPERFMALLAAEGVTVLSLTPSAFAQLLEHLDENRLQVKLITLGGETLEPHLLVDWFDKYDEEKCRVVNLYGITETTVHVTSQVMTRKHALLGSRSVGVPLPGWTIQVRDTHGRPTPIGVPGEIWVGGVGLALAYYNRPELTAERFVYDSYSGNDRHYRSGDVGRFDHAGRLHHLGRMDSQVKIRGYRVEVEEVRSVLVEDSAVRDAAVLFHAPDPNRPELARLDAYIVPYANEAFSSTQRIRERAARLLPSYMVPATFTVLAALPLTPNGKLDVATLRGTGKQAVAADTAMMAETREDELSGILHVWSTVMACEVGPDSNFFELGGNSLLAVRLIRAIENAGLATAELRQLYLTPTPRSFFSAAGRTKSRDGGGGSEEV